MQPVSPSFIRFLAALLVTYPVFAQGQNPALETACVDPEKQLCFCVTREFKPIIAAKLARFREEIRAARSGGRLVGYLSVPLSSRGGGYFVLNAEFAESLAQRIKERLGEKFSFIVNPASPDGDLKIGDRNASQADYLYMWTQLLWGDSTPGQDFDFVYFAGWNDFARFLGLGERAQLEQLSRYFDARQKTDKNFAELVLKGKIRRETFLTFYGVRATAAFSNGAHDEWNTVVAANRARRIKGSQEKEGIPNQLAMWFDARPVEPGGYEDFVSPGNAEACRPSGGLEAMLERTTEDPLDRRGY